MHDHTHQHHDTRTPMDAERASRLVSHWAEHLHGHAEELAGLTLPAELAGAELQQTLDMAKARMLEAAALLQGAADQIRHIADGPKS